MKYSQYPKVFEIGHEATRAGVRQILYWNERDLFIEMRGYDINTPLEVHLFEHREDYNARLEEKEKENLFLTDEFIKEIVTEYNKYRDFKSKLSISEVAMNLTYHHEHPECPGPILNSVFEFFQDNMAISLYDEPYYEMIKEKYPMTICKIHGYDFVALKDCPTFAIDGNANIVPFNGYFYNEFIEDILKCMRVKFENDTKVDANHRFPQYVEDVQFYPGDKKYVFVDNKFVLYDENIHKNEPLFKRLGKVY